MNQETKEALKEFVEAVDAVLCDNCELCLKASKAKATLLAALDKEETKPSESSVTSPD